MAEGVISARPVPPADDPDVLPEFGPAHRTDVDDVDGTGGVPSPYPAGATTIGTGTPDGTYGIVGAPAAGPVVRFVGGAAADDALIGEAAGVLLVGQSAAGDATGRCRPARFVLLLPTLHNLGEAVLQHRGDLLDDILHFVVLDGIVAFGGSSSRMSEGRIGHALLLGDGLDITIIHAINVVATDRSSR